MNQTAKVSELKAKLSGYLAQVRRGDTVTVCDRQTPIALLVPIAGAAAGLEVREPTDANDLPMAPRITLKEGIDVVELLRVDRDDR